MSVFPNPGLSHVVGATDAPLIETTIGVALHQAAAKWPAALAVIDTHDEIRWSWRELDALADNVAANFLACGLNPGDRIGVWSLNRADWVLLQFAAARAGLILVTINPAYRIEELKHALTLSSVRALFVSTPFKTSDYVAILKELAPELRNSENGVVKSDALPDLARVFGFKGAGAPQFAPFEDLYTEPSSGALSHLRNVEQSLSANDQINIQFTSGTTGAPKGATLSHRNILNNGANLARALSLTSADRLCLPVPLYHCFGMVMGVLACVTSGSALVLTGPGFDPEKTVSAIVQEKCTALYGVPTMFVDCLSHISATGISVDTLRTGVMAGALCPIELMRAARHEIGVSELIIAYGMTETSPVSFQTAPSDPEVMQVSTVGRVQPNIECKIIDAEGKTLPTGDRGELCTRGYSVMTGYWGQPDQTADAIDPEGWMHSGDIAVIDDEGYCRIVGRIKDMIIRGGENIYPAEIEAHLRKHPGIAGVEVVGIPHPKWGETVCACVILADGTDLSEEDVRDFCRNKIAHYKVPEHVFFVKEFPMTVTGKIQKAVLRADVTKLI